jgi:hypothetical protein
MTRTTRLRRMILHLAHIFFTDGRTFIAIASVGRAFSIPARESKLYLIAVQSMQGGVSGATAINRRRWQGVSRTDRD